MELSDDSSTALKNVTIIGGLKLSSQDAIKLNKNKGLHPTKCSDTHLVMNPTQRFLKNRKIIQNKILSEDLTDVASSFNQASNNTNTSSSSLSTTYTMSSGS